MAETKPAKKDTKRTAKSTTPSNKTFTADERAAMRERAKELKAAKNREGWERELLAKIAEMPAQDRALAERLHAIVTASAPELAPKTWYGMPAYARDGKVLFFFQSAAKFKARYATLGFNDPATLDDGDMWPTAFALTVLTPEVEARIEALIERATA